MADEQQPGNIQFDFEEPDQEEVSDLVSPIQDIDNLDLKKERDLYFKRKHQILAEGDQRLKDAQKTAQWRDSHLKMLFWLTVIWVAFLCFLVLLIGYKKFFLWPLMNTVEWIPFELDNTVIVAFFTTTTATVLGLYTVAALWLFKGEKKNSSPDE